MAIWVIHSSVPLESTALMNFYFYPICKFTDRAVYLDILSLLCPTYIYIYLDIRDLEQSMLEKKNVINVEVYITNEDVHWFAAHAIFQAGIVPK